MAIPFTCPHCGTQSMVTEQYAGQSGPCAGCGRTITVPPAGNPFAAAPQLGLGDDAAMRILLPVGRSVLAILAGYAGLFSVLVFPAPIALILGILAVRDIRRHPEKHGMGRAIFGIVMGGLFSIMLVFMLVRFSIASFAGA